MLPLLCFLIFPRDKPGASALAAGIVDVDAGNFAQG
jgi:hypothetical protein